MQWVFGYFALGAVSHRCCPDFLYQATGRRMSLPGVPTLRKISVDFSQFYVVVPVAAGILNLHF